MGPRVRVPAVRAGARVAPRRGARVRQPPEGRLRRPDLPASVGAPVWDTLRQALRPRWRGAALGQAPHALRVLIKDRARGRFPVDPGDVGGVCKKIGNFCSLVPCHCARARAVYDVIRTQCATIVCHWMFVE